MLKSIIAIAALAAAGSVSATTVLFSDDFESETPRLAETSSLNNWTVDGNVDVVGMPNSFGITCAGNCVDLAGTPGPGAILSNPVGFAAGQRLTISFDLSGNQRNSATDVFDFLIALDGVNDWQNVTLLSGFASLPPFDFNSDQFAISLAIPGTAAFTTYSLAFTLKFAGTVALGFSGVGGGDARIGPLVDNVQITQGVIPEPATWAMLIAGFGLVGTAMRRRRTAVAA